MQVTLFGAAFGLSHIGIKFDPTCDYAACRLCGKIYQSDLDRLHTKDYAMWLRNKHVAAGARQGWRLRHTQQEHTQAEVDAFAKTGLTYTAEAAHRLAPFGAIAPNDAIFNDEIASALLEAPRMPVADVEGS